MNISELLNPVPNKKPRFTEDTLVCNKYWLPTELIALIMMFIHFYFRPTLRLVSKEWYIAYDLYYRNKVFCDVMHIGYRNVTRKQVLNAFVIYGHQLHWMYVYTSTFREILDVETNFASLIPNIISLRVIVNDGLTSQRWIRDFAAKLSKLKVLVIKESVFTADEHLAIELDKAFATIPQLMSVSINDIDLDFNAFPGPSMKARAKQMVELVMSVANIGPGLVASTFMMFKNVRGLGFRGISGVGVLKEITEMVVDEKNFPAMNVLEVQSEFDLSHAGPIVNEEDGSKVTAMDLYLKICSIRRPKFELRVGFILGACSTTNSALIEKEREFIINIGKISAELLADLELTHYPPSGDYDPLTSLLYESASRFPRLLWMDIHASPTAATGPRIIEALNNPFLLPHLVQVRFYVDGTQSPEWGCRFNPIDPSRGLKFGVVDMQHTDYTRMINENNDGTLPSHFICDCVHHKKT